MNDIAIDPKYTPQILSGRKTTTVRSGRRDYQLVPGTLGEFDIMILEVAYSSLELALRHHKTDGFEHPMHMVDALREFYPDLSLDDEVTTVTFGVVS